MLKKWSALVSTKRSRLLANNASEVCYSTLQIIPPERNSRILTITSFTNNKYIDPWMIYCIRNYIVFKHNIKTSILDIPQKALTELKEH